MGMQQVLFSRLRKDQFVGRGRGSAGNLEGAEGWTREAGGLRYKDVDAIRVHSPFSDLHYDGRAGNADAHHYSA